MHRLGEHHLGQDRERGSWMRDCQRPPQDLSIVISRVGTKGRCGWPDDGDGYGGG